MTDTRKSWEALPIEQKRALHEQAKAYWDGPPNDRTEMDDIARENDPVLHAADVRYFLGLGPDDEDEKILF
jgi:hypothetical protein